MQRPVITDYQDLTAFISEMLVFLRLINPKFSVLQATQNLRKVSPALVSLILKKKRRLTLDRVDELSKLLQLSPNERQYLRDWVSRDEGGPSILPLKTGGTLVPPRRKAATSHILTDWVNVFVKDAFQIPTVSQHPDSVFAILGGIASRKRVEQSLKFLLKHGYLRKTVDGHIIPETPLHSVDPLVPNAKVRQFHKAALSNAREAIDQHEPNRRYANAMVITLNEASYKKLTEIIAEQAEELQHFAENLTDGDQLYQLVVNLSPTGGRREST